MPQEGFLKIVNNIPDTTMSVQVYQSTCCDYPNPGQGVDGLQFYTPKTLPYARTGGHGCDGNQGTFNLRVEVDGSAIGNIAFNFDSDGMMAYPNGDPTIGFIYDASKTMISIGKPLPGQ